MYNDSFKSRYKTAPIAISENLNGENTKAHIHNEIEMLYIIKGSTLVTIGENTFTANAGDLIFANPFEVHSLVTDTKADYHHKCICFDLSLLADKEIAKKLQNGEIAISHHIKDSIADSHKIKDCFNSLYSAVEKSENSLLFESSAYISLIFTMLIKNNFLTSTVKTEKSAVFCKKVIKYISENFYKEITSKDIATELFYTQSYFCRAFQANFSTSFSDYLNMYRISLAKNMLVNSNAKVSEIAFMCGFSSPEYFIRCFKKHIGFSPNKYRKSQYSTV